MPPTPQPTDAELAERVRAGNLEALGDLYARYATKIMSLATRFTGETADAEDVVHDVFLGLPEALRSYEERGSLESWLKRLTVRVALSSQRSGKRRREVPLDEAAETPQQINARGDSHGALDTAIRELPDSLRAVFVLREIEGYAHADIALLLGITPGASEVRLSRAMRLLRLRLVNER